MQIQCPKCDQSFGVEPVATIPDSQSFKMKLTSESEFFTAKIIGETIVNMDSLQRAIADSLGFKIEVFVNTIDLHPKEITIGFQIVKVATQNHKLLTPQSLQQPLTSEPTTSV